MLAKANYAWVYAAGPRKKHGCAVVFRANTFEEVGSRTVFYDDEEVHIDGAHSPGEESAEEQEQAKARRASSRITKNIANIVALKRIGDDDVNDGVVVATTHLFWHPR